MRFITGYVVPDYYFSKFCGVEDIAKSKFCGVEDVAKSNSPHINYCIVKFVLDKIPQCSDKMCFYKKNIESVKKEILIKIKENLFVFQHIIRSMFPPIHSLINDGELLVYISAIF